MQKKILAISCGAFNRDISIKKTGGNENLSGTSQLPEKKFHSKIEKR